MMDLNQDMKGVESRLSASIGQVNLRPEGRQRGEESYSQQQRRHPNKYRAICNKFKPQQVLLIIAIILINHLSLHLCLQANFNENEQASSSMAAIASSRNSPNNPNLVPSHPSQSFLSPGNKQPIPSISLVSGFQLKKSDEEEDGFIMKTASSAADSGQNGLRVFAPVEQVDATSGQREEPSTTGGSIDEQTASIGSLDSTATLVAAPVTTSTTIDDQRIPIDVNRQQFVTHDQLSLLNASTKDENIYLSGTAGDEPPSQRVQPSTSSRAGMSKVSHVSSFLSDLFAYAVRPRPGGPSESELAGFQRNALAPVTSKPQPQQQQQQSQTQPPQLSNSSPATCPGVCRSYFTATLLCRNEIVAPCPSVFQRCCEKDDVSFNGTPVETSAPLNPAESEPNTAPLSDNVSPNQEQTTLDQQATLPATSAPSTNGAQTTPRSPTSVSSAATAAATSTAATTSTTTTTTTITTPAPTTTEKQPSRSNADQTGDGVENRHQLHQYQLLAGKQPASVYFLSSANGSSEQYAATGGSLYEIGQLDGGSGQLSPDSGSTAAATTTTTSKRQQQQVELAQSAHEEQTSGQRFKSPASQSFDSPLNEKKSDSSSSVGSSSSSSSSLEQQQAAANNRLANQVVVLHTANGTIIHQPGERFRRPIYTNWTDYQLSLFQNRPSGGQVVNYHSNIDPVKRFVESAPVSSSTTASASTTAATTTTPAARMQPASISSDFVSNSGPRDDTCTGQCMPRTQQRYCQVLAGSGSSRCDSENDFCCLQLSDESSVKRMSLATPGSDIRQETFDQTQLRVINDQHSGARYQPTRHSATIETVAPTTPTTTTTTSTTQRPAPSTTTEQQLAPSGGSTDSAAASESVPLAGVGNVLVELLDSWISGQSSQQQQPGSSSGSTGGDEQSPSDQQNDKRLGLDLSFRQQSSDPSPNNTSRRQQQQQFSSSESGLMTSDGAMEPSGQVEPGRCSGYCILRLFTMLCDSTYSSPDCGANQECCVSGKQGQDTASSGEEVDQQSNEQQQQHQQSTQAVVRPQQVQICRGTCLPVYHASLCTKPSELQFDSPGCLPNQVCCNQQAANSHHQDPTTNHLEDVDASGLLASSLATSNSAPSPVAIESTPQHHLLKDNSLLAALLPSPPPPPISIAATLNPEQQLVHEKSSMSDQFLAATGRQRQAAPIAPLEPAYQIYQAQQQQQQQQQQVRPNANGPKNSQSGGIMSQLYQMFKSTGRQRQPQAQQQQQPQQQVSNQHPQAFPMQHQLYEHPFANQMQSGAHLSPVVSQPPQQKQQQQQQQQQLMFPNNNLMNQQKHYQQANNGYQLDQSNLVDIKQQQQQQNRNRFAPQQLHLDQQQVQHQYAQPQQVMHKFNAQPPQHQQQPKVPYQQPQVTPVLHPFSADNKQPMMIEKFATPNGESLLAYNSNNLQLHGQQQTPVNYVKSAAMGSQVSQQQKQPVNLQPQQQQQLQQQQQPQQQSNFAFPDRQRYHFNADNAHYNQQMPPKSGTLQPLPAATKPVAQPSFSDQQVAAATVDKQSVANKLELNPIVQQQQQQPHPTGSGRPPNRQQDQRFVVSNVANAVTTTSVANSQVRNGNVAEPATLNVDQTKSSIVRQNNPVTRPPSSAPSPLPTDHLRHPADVAANHIQSFSGQQVHARPATQTRPQQADPAIRAQSGSGNRAQPLTRRPPSLPEAHSALSASSSNLNVLISGAPHLDLQRVESALEGLRRQVTAAQVAASTPSGHNIKVANTHPHVPTSPQSTVATSSTSDDLSSQPEATHSNAPAAPTTCSSTCLAPIVAFNCVRPNYIDESFACPTPGALCCVKALPTATSTGSLTDLSSPKKDLLQQTASTWPQSLTSSQAVTGAGSSSVDTNKLDSSPAADDPQDSDQADSDGDSKVSDNPDNVAIEEHGNLSASNKGRFPASSCGVPGPRRRTSGRAKGRVMGGFDSKPGYWCWQAALMNNKNEYLCGGALIGMKWVLTAAHCVTQHMRNENQLYVRLGQHNLNSSTVDRYAKTIQVKNSYVHHNHNGETLDNDIALLRLEEAVDLEESNSICLVCLPERSSQIEPGKRCSVTGYGFETENGPAALRVRQTELPIVSDAECQKKTTKVLGKPFTLPASSFCAGGELGQDACHGDGGSPLSCLVDGFYELTGIVSWGYKCGSKDLPGLYAKVSTFVGWINQIVSVNN